MKYVNSDSDRYIETLLGPGGTLCPSPPCQVFACSHANTRRSVLKKLEIEFGKGQYAFYPIKLSRFSEKKNKVRQNYQNFIRRDPYKMGQTPVNQQKTSGILLNMANHSTKSHFQKELEA